MLSYRERQRDECGLLLVGEVERNGDGRCVHTPDQDYVPEGSCHTCLPLRPDLSLSGQHCTHRGSCPSHSIYLSNQAQNISTNHIAQKQDLTSAQQ